MVEKIDQVGKREPFKEGDVVVVVREDGGEEAGIVHYITGELSINYGGVISLVHDGDQIQLVPEEIRDALVLRLNQNEEDLQRGFLRATENVRDALKDYLQQ